MNTFWKINELKGSEKIVTITVSNIGMATKTGTWDPEKQSFTQGSRNVNWHSINVVISLKSHIKLNYSCAAM